jgi:hypothetical protein
MILRLGVAGLVEEMDGADWMGAARPQTPRRSPRQAFGGNYGGVRPAASGLGVEAEVDEL